MVSTVQESSKQKAPAYVLQLGAAKIYFRRAMPSRTGNVKRADRYPDQASAEAQAARLGPAWRVVPESEVRG